MCQRFNGTEKRLDGGLVIVVPPSISKLGKNTCIGNYEFIPTKLGT